MTFYNIRFDDDAGHHSNQNYAPQDSSSGNGYDFQHSGGLPYDLADFQFPSSLPPPSAPIQMSSFQLSDFADAEDIRNNWVPSYTFDNNEGMMVHDARIHEPMPVRPVSPQVLYHETALATNEAGPSTSRYLDESAGSSSRTNYFPTNPSIFTPAAEGTWSIAQQVPPSNPPSPPPPSWAMSGSLDPNTGEYKRATESTRVRTEHACEPCRRRKAKCTGERVCRRCRLRGLDCVYGEKKTRGKNKPKPKAIDLDKAKVTKKSRRQDRRTSTVSNASISSSSSSSSSGNSALELFQNMSLGGHSSEASDSSTSPPSSGSSSGSASSSARASPTSSPTTSPSQIPTLSRRSRPPRLSFVPVPGIFDHYAEPPLPIPEDVSPFPDPSSIRRGSLPAHLLDSFPGGDYSSQPYMFGNISEPMLNAHASSSTHITPIPIATNSAHPFHYPYQRSGLSDFMSSQSSYDHLAVGDELMGGGEMGMSWPESMMDLDPTPMPGSGREKELGSDGESSGSSSEST
ncbi:hypothetical protein BXZ70DRAFT_1011186 [Cristinia sonorae]|uniref:Zn(2)-C6 fungal-type domain-containing protein n=1 Tax=Cristinia sonorae TaxID=1940300 RepID=A0A8K0UHX3_9AGAR|nr:hypothetical protein BXZ70DRAFT_1011186 [Cristinia sonorae]